MLIPPVLAAEHLYGCAGVPAEALSSARAPDSGVAKADRRGDRIGEER